MNHIIFTKFRNKPMSNYDNKFSQITVFPRFIFLYYTIKSPFFQGLNRDFVLT